MNIEGLPTAREWWQALRWVLLFFTAIVALTMAGSFFTLDTVVTQGHPWLPLKTCTGCPFCGMTRSFCAMSAGLWSEAFKFNAAGPFLYLFGWVWLASFGVYMSRIIKNYGLKLQSPKNCGENKISSAFGDFR